MTASNFDVVENWAVVPDDIKFGEVASVAVGPDDRVYLLTRKDPHIIVMEQDGTFVRTWGEGLLSFRPHGITIGPDNIVYCVDEANHIVYAFSHDGTLLGTFGSGNPSDTGMNPSVVDYTERTRTVVRSAGPFNLPTALAVAPDGSIYISDGYGNSRIHHFSADRELIASWGAPGSGAGEFRVPHGISVAPDGRVLVADRENDRIQVFAPDGEFVESWNDLHRPTDITFDTEGFFYITEFPSKEGHYSYAHGHLHEKRPARLTVTDSTGRPLDRFGDAGDPADAGNFAVPHALAIDSNGDLYVAEVVASSVMYNDPNAPAGGGDWALPSDCHTLQKFARRR